MARFDQEAVIKASPDQVFAYVADLPRHAEWATHNLEVKQTSSGEAGVGSTFASVGHQFGTQRENLTIIDYSAGKRFAFESEGKLGLMRHAFDLEAVDGGTRVTKSMDVVRAALMTRLMAPLISRQTSKGLAEDLRRIKKHLES